MASNKVFKTLLTLIAAILLHFVKHSHGMDLVKPSPSFSTSSVRLENLPLPHLTRSLQGEAELTCELVNAEALARLIAGHETFAKGVFGNDDVQRERRKQLRQRKLQGTTSTLLLTSDMQPSSDELSQDESRAFLGSVELETEGGLERSQIAVKTHFRMAADEDEKASRDGNITASSTLSDSTEKVRQYVSTTKFWGVAVSGKATKTNSKKVPYQALIIGVGTQNVNTTNSIFLFIDRRSTTRNMKRDKRKVTAIAADEGVKAKKLTCFDPLETVDEDCRSKVMEDYRVAENALKEPFQASLRSLDHEVNQLDLTRFQDFYRIAAECAAEAGTQEWNPRLIMDCVDQAKPRLYERYLVHYGESRNTIQDQTVTRNFEVQRLKLNRNTDIRTCCTVAAVATAKETEKKKENSRHLAALKEMVHQKRSGLATTTTVSISQRIPRAPLMHQQRRLQDASNANAQCQYIGQIDEDVVDSLTAFPADLYRALTASAKDEPTPNDAFVTKGYQTDETQSQTLSFRKNLFTVELRQVETSQLDIVELVETSESVPKSVARFVRKGEFQATVVEGKQTQQGDGTVIDFVGVIFSRSDKKKQLLWPVDSDFLLGATGSSTRRGLRAPAVVLDEDSNARQLAPRRELQTVNTDDGTVVCADTQTRNEACVEEAQQSFGQDRAAALEAEQVALAGIESAIAALNVSLLEDYRVAGAECASVLDGWNVTLLSRCLEDEKAPGITDAYLTNLLQLRNGRVKIARDTAEAIAIGRLARDNALENCCEEKSEAPTASPTSLPTAVPSPTPTVAPTSTLLHNAGNSSAEQSVPSPSPTAAPSKSPTGSPSQRPTDIPSQSPMVNAAVKVTSPTAFPTRLPSVAPSPNPTARPSSDPSLPPTSRPTGRTIKTKPTPSTNSTTVPSHTPMKIPTNPPTHNPTPRPTSRPTTRPTRTPRGMPTNLPTATPSTRPTSAPSAHPTSAPSAHPTSTPSAHPTSTPSAHPTSTPSVRPTSTPSARPTSTPSVRPTSTPSARPTSTPSVRPTSIPSARPTSIPSARPTSIPSARPTSTPSVRPTSSPSARPTRAPTNSPTNTPTTSLPTTSPSSSPTAAPTTQKPTLSPTARPSSSPTPCTPQAVVVNIGGGGNFEEFILVTEGRHYMVTFHNPVILTSLQVTESSSSTGDVEANDECFNSIVQQTIAAGGNDATLSFDNVANVKTLTVQVGSGGAVRDLSFTTTCEGREATTTFESTAEGLLDNNVVFDGSFTVTAQRSEADPATEAAYIAFDATLMSKVLFIQTDGGTLEPNTEGGTLTVQFSQGVMPVSFLYKGDLSGGDVTLLDQNQLSVGLWPLPTSGDNTQTVFFALELPLSGVRYLRFRIQGVVSIDDLTYDPVQCSAVCSETIVDFSTDGFGAEINSGTSVVPGSAITPEIPAFLGVSFRVNRAENLSGAGGDGLIYGGYNGGNNHLFINIASAMMNPGGGVIMAIFWEPVKLTHFVITHVPTGKSVAVEVASDSSGFSQSFTPAFDGQDYSLPSQVNEATRLTLTFSGEGALDDLRFAPSSCGGGGRV